MSAPIPCLPLASCRCAAPPAARDPTAQMSIRDFTLEGLEQAINRVLARTPMPAAGSPGCTGG